MSEHKVLKDMLIRSCWLLWFLACFVCIESTGFAAEKAPKLAKTLEAFRKAHLEGEALTRQKKYKPALVKFQLAYKLLLEMVSKTKSTKRKAQLIRFQKRYSATMGSAYHYARGFLLAHFYYRRCIAFAKKEKSLRTSCQRYLRVVNGQLTFLKITTVPKAQILWAPRESPGKISLVKGMWMLPGTLRVKIRRKGYQGLEKEITLKAGAIAELRYILQKMARCKVPKKRNPKDELTIGPPQAAALIFPTAQDSRVLQMNPAVPRPWPAWQTALVIGGVAAGVGLAALGGYAIYRANNTVYTWNPQGR